MPWNERTRMDERVLFVSALSSCEYTMTELCEVYGISRKTGYKWARRYLEEGVDGLKDRSRAPKSGRRTERRCVEALLEARGRHPTWGPRKLLERLRRRHPGWAWPAPSSAGEILKRHGLVKPRRRRRQRPVRPAPQNQAAAPNQLWTVDFKGEFRLGNRQWCFPLTVMDRSSRYLLACEGKISTAHAGVRPVFETLFSEYGLPTAILSDQGTPFASARAVRGLSRLSVWWIKLGIQPILTQPGHPEQNGCHERMHRTLKAETTRPPAAGPRAQQAVFERFRREYNDLRPHEALDLQTPSECYQASPRRYPPRLPPVSYPDHFHTRRVRDRGDIRWQGRRIFLSEVLEGEWVGIEEVDDDLWSLHFGPLLLGRYDGIHQDVDLL